MCPDAEARIGGLCDLDYAIIEALDGTRVRNQDLIDVRKAIVE